MFQYQQKPENKSNTTENPPSKEKKTNKAMFEYWLENSTIPEEDSKGNSTKTKHSLYEDGQQKAPLQEKEQEALPDSLFYYFNDNPEHDPSLIDDQTIEGTKEYREFRSDSLRIPVFIPPENGTKNTHEPSPLTNDEAVLACKLILRALRDSYDGFEGNVQNNTLFFFNTFIFDNKYDFALKARKQLGSLDSAHTLADPNEISDQGTIKLGNGSATDFGVNLNYSTSWDGFPRWARSGAKPPLDMSIPMNCWDAIFAAAYIGGFISPKWLSKFYENNSLSAMRHLIELSNTGQTYHTDNTAPRPLPGDLVFFNGKGLDHVALATGNMVNKNETEETQVISFWRPPDNPLLAEDVTDDMEYTTIEELIRFYVNDEGYIPEVKFTTAPW